MHTAEKIVWLWEYPTRQMPQFLPPLAGPRRNQAPLNRQSPLPTDRGLLVTCASALGLNRDLYTRRIYAQTEGQSRLRFRDGQRLNRL